MTYTTTLYFESHITIEPVFDSKLEEFKRICISFGFKPATLLMQKRKEDTPERSKYDTFATGRSKNYDDLYSRTIGLVHSLCNHEFKVWRYKIENTLLDMRVK